MSWDFEFVLDDEKGVVIEGNLPQKIKIGDCLITIHSGFVMFEKNGNIVQKTAEEFYDFLTEVEWGLI